MTRMLDPIERMELNIDRLCWDYITLQKDVPSESFCCPYCMEVREGEPIQMSASPDSAACCYECLPEETKMAYDAFFGH